MKEEEEKTGRKVYGGVWIHVVYLDGGISARGIRPRDRVRNQGRDDD